MECIECGAEMETVDTTISMFNSDRAYKGQHTGDIYYCEHCERHFLDNFLTDELECYSY